MSFPILKTSLWPQYALFLCALGLPACSPSKKSYCELSNEAVLMYCRQSFERSGGQKAYFDSILMYRPTYPEAKMDVEQRYDQLVFPVTTEVCRLVIPDSLKPYCDYYPGDRDMLNDSVSVFRCSPLLKTKHKKVFGVQIYALQGGNVTDSKLRLSVLRMRKVKVTRNKLKELPGIDYGENMSVWSVKKE